MDRGTDRRARTERKTTQERDQGAKQGGGLSARYGWQDQPLHSTFTMEEDAVWNNVDSTS